jgi:hypothetical protein
MGQSTLNGTQHQGRARRQLQMRVTLMLQIPPQRVFQARSRHHSLVVRTPLAVIRVTRHVATGDACNRRSRRKRLVNQHRVKFVDNTITCQDVTLGNASLLGKVNNVSDIIDAHRAVLFNRESLSLYSHTTRAP